MAQQTWSLAMLSPGTVSNQEAENGTYEQYVLLQPICILKLNIEKPVEPAFFLFCKNKASVIGRYGSHEQS